jgi:hypothetical protein
VSVNVKNIYLFITDISIFMLIATCHDIGTKIANVLSLSIFNHCFEVPTLACLAREVSQLLQAVSGSHAVGAVNETLMCRGTY